MPKQNILQNKCLQTATKSGVMKSTVHLHGTFKDYLNHIKSHHVIQG